jgi:transposase InsO family protein
VERGIEVDHVTVFRRVQRFTPLLAEAARYGRHAPGDRWFVDETYVKVNGVWRYVYRAIDEHAALLDGASDGDSVGRHSGTVGWRQCRYRVTPLPPARTGEPRAANGPVTYGAIWITDWPTAVLPLPNSTTPR